MASLAAARRLSARLLAGRAAARSFSTSSHSLAAQNFIMPALSPTMTEGNIASWKVKEGEAFSAGDVLLEIETDKATMDVEAQEDGIMMKIMSRDGAKAVQVGTRIAVLAEAGDDIASLELPAAETSAQQPASTAEPSSSSPSSSSSSAAAASPSPQKSTSTASAPGSYQHRYPLLPSVGQLVKQNGLTREDVARIKGTGPHGRLLKGDVLASLGAIGAERPEALSAHFHKLAYLDLANIKVAARAPAPAAEKRDAALQAPAEPATVEVQVPLLLTRLFELRHSLHDKLGAHLDVDDFIRRAARIANQDLGPSALPPTPDELFDQLLGLDRLKAATRGSTRGRYRPVVSAVIPALGDPAPRAKPDIIDLLAGPATTRTKKRAARAQDRVDAIPGAFLDESMLSLTVPKGDRKRAERFLQRCKILLEENPQTLVQL
ncbi:Pyruvate dehydrogenase complex protein X component [Escovopsis weberi]|uniref:Pyruvate dehydrogenase complex protein X component n=1 Tax=Escovopsis weberi TaxID=150374 RepID=A0A0M8MZT6_ESCWE|nr:Pyruvate dehydrogenase complex protein X component [Escovopsis weberi]